MKFAFSLIFPVLCVWNHLLFAQSLQEELLPQMQFETYDVLQQLQQTQQLAISVSDGAVDPEQYTVGPGDIFLLQVTGPLSQSGAIAVSPDGKLPLPRAGNLHVAGRLLKDVEEMVVQFYQRYNPNVAVTLTLVRPRQVIIHVDGDIPLSGAYTFPANLRAATVVQLILMLYQAQQKEKNSQNTQLLQWKQWWQQQEIMQQIGPVRIYPYSSRHLYLTRETGKTLDLDPLRGAFSEHRAEPHLQEGDRIFVPPPPEDYPRISVFGDVPLPAVFPYREGDHLQFALRVAGVDSLPLSARILIHSPQGSREYTAEQWEQFSSLKLAPGTAILVASPKKPVPSVAGVIGDVPFPGVYPIEVGKTRVADLVALAGGFAHPLSAQQAYILRLKDSELQEQQLYEFFEAFRAFPVKYFDTLHYRIDFLTRRSKVLCNVQKAVEDPASDQNYLLQPGDFIVVPKLQHAVYIFGQVQQAGYIPYAPGKDLRWYLQQAGGLNPVADAGAIQVWKAAKGGWVAADETVIEPGDQIYVPREYAFSPAERMQNLGVILGIASSAAVLITSILNIIQLR